MTKKAGWHHNKETKDKISKSNIGKHTSNSGTFKKNNPYRFKKGHKLLGGCQFKKGNKPWICGFHHSKNSKIKMSKARIEYYKTHCHPLSGKHLTKKTCQKISLTRKYMFKTGNLKSVFIKGHKINKNRHLTLETKNKISQSLKGKPTWNVGKHHSKKTKAKMSQTHKKPENIKKFLKSLLKSPTSLERRYTNLFEKNKILLSFTGNGSLLVGNKNPDFTNKRKKIAVDVRNTKVCIYLAKQSFADYRKERTKHFNKHGWRCLVFSEKDLSKPEEIIYKINRLFGMSGIKKQTLV